MIQSLLLTQMDLLFDVPKNRTDCLYVGPGGELLQALQTPLAQNPQAENAAPMEEEEPFDTSQSLYSDDSIVGR